MHRRIILLIAAATAASAQSNIANPDLPNFAAGVLQQTRMARQAIASRERDAAIGHIKQAIATVNEIQQKAPDGARPLLIPVYSQVDTTTTVTPVHKNADLKAQLFGTRRGWPNHYRHARYYCRGRSSAGGASRPRIRRLERGRCRARRGREQRLHCADHWRYAS